MNDRTETFIQLPATAFKLLDERSPGFARLSKLPPVQVAVRPAPPSPAPRPVAPLPPPSPAPLASAIRTSPLPPLTSDQREIVALRKALKLPMPVAYRGRT